MPHAEESSPFYAYSHYSGVPQGHEAVAESQANYAMVESPNGTAAQMSPQQAAIVKRRDQARRTKAPSIVAVKKYTVTSRWKDERRNVVYLFFSNLLIYLFNKNVNMFEDYYLYSETLLWK